MKDDIELSAEYRLRHELLSENPPRKIKVDGRTVHLTDEEWNRWRNSNITHNAAVRKSVTREVRERRVAAADNNENVERAMGSTSPKVWSPDVQYSNLRAPFCARFSEKSKDRMAMIVVFAPVLAVALGSIICGLTK